MKVLFKFAMLWGWVPPQTNPMSLFSVPGITKRVRKPRVINMAQFQALLEHFRADLRMRTMITGGYCLGLGASELFGLKWRDFDHLGSSVKGAPWRRRGPCGADEESAQKRTPATA